MPPTAYTIFKKVKMKTARQQAETDIGIKSKTEYTEAYTFPAEAKTITEFAKSFNGKGCSVQNIHKTFAAGRNKGWEIVIFHGKLFVILKKK